MLSIFSCTYWPPLCLFRSNAHLKNNLIYSVILAVLSLCCCAGFSLVAASGGYPRCAPASHCGGFSCGGVQARGRMVLSSCSTWAQQLQFPGSRAPAQWLCMSWVALQWVGSSWTRDGNHVSCIGRQLLYHWATRKAPNAHFLLGGLFFFFGVELYALFGFFFLKLTPCWLHHLPVFSPSLSVVFLFYGFFCCGKAFKFD